MTLHPTDASALPVEDLRALLNRIDIHIEVPTVKHKELGVRLLGRRGSLW